MNPAPKDPQGKVRNSGEEFETFTASQVWRDLPLKIKLMVVHIWRRENDTPPPDNR